MGRKKILKEKTLLAAIAGSRGVISTIAERLDMNWHTVRNAIDESEAARQALADEEETALDFVENKAYERIEAGDGQMIRFVLATKGKRRGYGTEETPADTAGDDTAVNINMNGGEPEPVEADA